jgi:hypothetical protein
MTSSEPVAVPSYLQVVSVILRLAAGLFYVHKLHDETPTREQEEDFEAWLVLRRTARLLCERSAMQLTLAEAYALREALRRCPRDADFEFLYRQDWDERG